MRPRIGLIVPSLEQGEGIPAVAEFVCDTIERSDAFDVQLVSLATSARDESGLALTRPETWLHGVRKRAGVWRGRPFTHVGAFVSELEFQRFQPRHALGELLADCDLMQVVCGSPAWAWSVCALNKPVAVLCASRVVVERRRRNATEVGLKAAWRRWMTGITDRLDQKVLQTVDAIQVMNPWMFDYAKAANAGRDVIIRYTPPGVDAGQFRPLVPARNLITDPYILCVGRLSDPRKNIKLLLEAYGNLPIGRREKVRLVLAGTTRPDAPFWARVKELGIADRVQFLDRPSTEELIHIYQGASIFALCSDEEGFGMVILEAMACGIPIVCTRSGGPDGIIVDGREGYLVDLNDAKAMTDRLTRLLSDQALNRRMGDAGRDTILRTYESSVAGRALLETYNDLLSWQRPPTNSNGNR